MEKIIISMRNKSFELIGEILKLKTEIKQDKQMLEEDQKNKSKQVASLCSFCNYAFKLSSIINKNQSYINSWKIKVVQANSVNFTDNFMILQRSCIRNKPVITLDSRKAQVVDNYTVVMELDESTCKVTLFVGETTAKSNINSIVLIFKKETFNELLIQLTTKSTQEAVKVALDINENAKIHVKDEEKQ